MADLFSFDAKQNGCGVLNPVCCDDSFSAWCETASGENHNRSRDWRDEPTKRQLMRGLFAGMLLAHGTPMLYGGDEWLRTQYGNNNAYSTRADNEYNWFRWGEWRAYDERWRMHDFVRELGATIVHPPEEGAWAPGYYSLLFEDPDGIRLEINHVPGKGLLEGRE